MEREIRSNVAKGKMGETSKVVDYIMYGSIAFSLLFGYVAFNKLQEQKDSLII